MELCGSGVLILPPAMSQHQLQILCSHRGDLNVSSSLAVDSHFLFKYFANLWELPSVSISSVNYWITSVTAYLVRSLAASWHPLVQRRGPAWSWSQRWGYSPGAGSSPAWLTVLTSTPLCPSHSLYTYVAPRKQSGIKMVTPHKYIHFVSILLLTRHSPDTCPPNP